MLNKILSFFSLSYESIVRDFHLAASKLEALAKREELKAEDFLATHLSVKALEADARDVAAKARATAANIRKLLG